MQKTCNDEEISLLFESKENILPLKEEILNANDFQKEFMRKKITRTISYQHRCSINLFEQFVIVVAM